MRVAEALRAHFGAAPPATLGVAVSGGSDSVALLHLLQDWHEEGGPALRVATVDHGLRPEAGAEAAQVARLCAGLGVAHETLRWDGAAARGNLPDAARRARYRLLAGWARRNGLRDVAIGHTADDVAETFVMRLARRAGVDGLAAMRARWDDSGVTFHRPMLSLGREGLRDMLRARGAGWADDPTNDDPAYARTRAREALAVLAPLGLGVDALAATALRLREARLALAACARRAAQDIARVEGGDLLLRRDGFADLPDEIARRLLLAGIAWMTGRDYPPRGAAAVTLLEAARAGRRMNLQGCVLSAAGDHLRLAREYRAVAGLRAPAGTVWDGRWRASGGPGRATVAALGAAGLRACPDWRAGGLPHGSALASPGLWRGDTLVAAPLAGWPGGWRLALLRGLDDYLDRVSG